MKEIFEKAFKEGRTNKAAELATGTPYVSAAQKTAYALQRIEALKKLHGLFADAEAVLIANDLPFTLTAFYGGHRIWSPAMMFEAIIQDSKPGDTLMVHLKQHLPMISEETRTTTELRNVAGAMAGWLRAVGENHP